MFYRKPDGRLTLDNHTTPKQRLHGVTSSTLHGKRNSTIHRGALDDHSSTPPCAQPISARRIRFADFGDPPHLTAHAESVTHAHVDHRRTTPLLGTTDLGHRHTTVVHPEGPATHRSPEEAVV